MMYSLPYNSEKSFTLTEKLFSAFILSALPLKVLTFVFSSAGWFHSSYCQ